MPTYNTTAMLALKVNKQVLILWLEKLFCIWYNKRPSIPKIDTNALTNSTNDMIKSSLEGLKGVSAEEVADIIINIHKKNISQNSEFYSSLDEVEK